MTSRLLLTLLALLTGLAAQASPAEARLHGARNAEMSMVAVKATETRKNIPAGLAALPARRSHSRFALQLDMPRRLGMASTPAVLTGIDRARE